MVLCKNVLGDAILQNRVSFESSVPQLRVTKDCKYKTVTRFHDRKKQKMSHHFVFI